MQVIADDCAVCVDCALAIANGDMPEDAERAAEVAAGLGLKDGAYWVLAGNDEEYFSWSSCDCCGSYLGGNRLNASIIGPEVA